MTNHRRYRAARTPRKPADAASGALHVRKFILKLFDREDGKAADWPLIAETLLREAFHALDQSPDDPRRLTLLRTINDQSYERLTRFLTERQPPFDATEGEASSTLEPQGRLDRGNGPGAVFPGASAKDQS